MPASSRFAVAVHVLALLHHEGGGPLASDYIAGSVNTNPVVIRRLLALLIEAELVRSQLGAGGGAILARPAAGISLADVYRAVEDGDLLAMHQGPNPECPVGRNIHMALTGVVDGAERAFVDALAGRTVADIVGRIAAAERKRS